MIDCIIRRLIINSVYHMRYIGDHVFFSKLMKQLLNRGTGISVSMVRVIPVLGLCCVVVGTYYTTMYVYEAATNKREMLRFVSCEPYRTHYTTCKVHAMNQNTCHGSIHMCI